MSCVEAHAGFFRLLIKGIFDPHVLRPFDKKLIYKLVTRLELATIRYVRGQILELPLEILWPIASFHLFSRAQRKSLFPQYPLSSWRILTWKLAVRRQGRPGGTQGTGTGSAENHIWPHFIFYVQWTLQKYTAATARLESGAGRQAKDSFTVEYMYSILEGSLVCI